MALHLKKKNLAHFEQSVQSDQGLTVYQKINQNLLTKEDPNQAVDTGVELLAYAFFGKPIFAPHNFHKSVLLMNCFSGNKNINIFSYFSK